MKRWILFSMFILVVQTGYKTIPVLAQDNENKQEIKNIIEKYLDSFVQRDLNSMMNLVSANYYNEKDNIDYNNFKSNVEKNIVSCSKKYVNYSNSDIEILKLDIQDNKATVEIEFNEKGFNLDTLREDSKKTSRFVTLAKENGFWKITKWSRLGQSE